MSDDNFFIHWNTHKQNLNVNLKKLLCAQKFVDVSLVSEGHYIQCHRMILAASSGFFDSILQDTGNKYPIIVLPSEIKLWQMQGLVDYMYRGEVTICKSGLTDFLKSAEILKIRGLYDVAEKLSEEEKEDKCLTMKKTTDVATNTDDSNNSSRKTPNVTDVTPDILTDTDLPSLTVSSTTSSTPGLLITNEERGNDEKRTEEVQTNQHSPKVQTEHQSRYGLGPPPPYQERGPIINNNGNFYNPPRSPILNPPVPHSGLPSTGEHSNSLSNNFKSPMTRRFSVPDRIVPSIARGDFYANELLRQKLLSSPPPPPPNEKRPRTANPQRSEPSKDMCFLNSYAGPYAKLPPLRKGVTPKSSRSSSRSTSNTSPFSPFNSSMNFRIPLHIPRSLPGPIPTPGNPLPPIPPMFYPDLSTFSNNLNKKI